jgi:hypothetical protein
VANSRETRDSILSGHAANKQITPPPAHASQKSTFIHVRLRNSLSSRVERITTLTAMRSLQGVVAKNHLAPDRALEQLRRAADALIEPARIPLTKVTWQRSRQAAQLRPPWL